MKFYLEGDKGKALCEHCLGLVSTTYVRRDVPFSDGNGVAKDILVGACDSCSAVVSIPAQSTPSIKAARAEANRAIEAKLPAVYFDLLDVAMQAISPYALTQHRKVFLGYFFHKMAGSISASEQLQSVHDHVIRSHFAGRALKDDMRKRLSMKINPSMSEDFEVLLERTHMSQTDLIKSTICQFQEDVLVTPNAAVINELKQLAKVAL